MCGAEKAIEIASYALIAAFGARLVWTKGGGFIRALQAPQPAAALAAAAHRHDHDHGHAPSPTIITHDHVHDEHCGHSHGPDPSELAGPGGWRRGFGAIFAVGVQALFGRDPGSGVRAGAGLVLGRHRRDLRDGARHRDHGGDHRRDRGVREGSGAAPERGREGGGALFMRGVEFGAAGLVLLFGVGLLFGYLAAERVTCL